MILKKFATKTQNFQNVKERISYLPELLTETIIYVGTTLSIIITPLILLGYLYRNSPDPRIRNLYLAIGIIHSAVNGVGMCVAWSDYRE